MPHPVMPGGENLPILRKKHIPKRLWLIGITFFVLLILLIISLFVNLLEKPKSWFPSQIGELPVITDLLPQEAVNRPGITREIRWIVIHETGNPSSGADAAAHNTYIHSISDDTELSWHYTVDDSCAYHHLPDTEVGWHAGDKLTPDGGNRNGIGIEICVNEDGDFEKAFENAAALTGYLLMRYELEPSQIKQHGDFISKNCPERIREGERTEEFILRSEWYREQFASGALSCTDMEA